MPDLDPELAVLSRALDQATRMLEEVTSARMTTPTPCRDWTTADLVDHMVMAPAKFAAMVRGEKVDWSVQSHVDSAPATAFRTGLLHG